MWRYVLRKTVLVIPLLFGVVSLIFILLELAPGTPADRYITPEMSLEAQENLRRLYGLDQPAWYRYGLMLWNLATFQLGVSTTDNRPVLHMLIETVPNTVMLSALQLAISLPLGVALGVWQAVRQGKPDDTGLSVVSLFFHSMPGFWLAVMLQLVFAYYLDLFPIDGKESPLAFTWDPWVLWPPEVRQIPIGVIYGPGHAVSQANESLAWNPLPWEHIKDLAWHLFLPGVLMGVAGSAGTARYMRSAMLEVIRQDYIRTARAKGLPEWRVIGIHALRNALLPIITLVGLTLPYLFAGSVLTEAIFSFPGMGRLILNAIQMQDTPVIIACFVIFTVIVVLGNLLADIGYALADPRVRYE
jgi:peptide/nickel transport system permease protein